MKPTRLSRAEKLLLAKNIFVKAEALIDDFGKPRTDCPDVVSAQIGDFNIVVITPRQIEMYHKNDKVFCAILDPQKPSENNFKCWRLVKGDWINSFLFPLDHAEAKASKQSFMSLGCGHA